MGELEIDIKALHYFINFCKDKHAEVNQLYDRTRGIPYSFHLEMVGSLARRYAHLYFDRREINIVVAVAYGHDLIENTRMTYNDVHQHLWNRRTSDAIYLLTEYRGRTRDERHPEQYFIDIANDRIAHFIKLCDIIANMNYSFMTGSNMFSKYENEWKNKVRDILFRDGEFVVLVSIIDSLISMDEASNQNIV